MPGWQVELVGAELVDDVEMRFAVEPLAEGEPVPLVWSAATPGGARSLAPGVRLVGEEVVVVTDHFSFWSLDAWGDALSGAVSFVSDKVDAMLAWPAQGKQPKCHGEAALRRAGFTVTSDSNRRVFWCAGMEVGRPVLRVVNARGYGVAAESTPGLTVLSSDRKGFVDMWADLLKSPPSKRGNTVNLLPTGNQVVYGVSGSSPVGVMVTADAGAYLLTALQFAVETFTFVLDRAGVKGRTRDLVTVLEGGQCLVAFSELATTELESPRDVKSFFGSALGLAMDCVGEAAGEMRFGPVLDFLVAPLVWVMSGVGTAVTGVVAAADLVTDLDGYRITIVPPAPRVYADGGSVAGVRFGTPAVGAESALRAVFGAPDADTGRVRLRNQFGGAQWAGLWFAENHIEAGYRWRYPWYRVVCWEALCVTFGGEVDQPGALRGWELSTGNRWVYDAAQDGPLTSPVVLAGSGFGLGGSWEEFKAAYPAAAPAGSEDYGLAIRGTPWPGWYGGMGSSFDGWQLSGGYEPGGPVVVPSGSTVVHMSAGEGPLRGPLD